MLPRNSNIRVGIANSCIIGRERGSDGTSLTSQAIKEMAGNLYFQTYKLHVSPSCVVDNDLMS